MEHLERLALIRPRRLLRKLRTQRLDNLLIAVSWNGQCWKKIGKSAMMYYGHDGHNRVMNGSECFWVVIKAITYQWPRHTYRWQALSGLLQHVAFLSYNVYIYILEILDCRHALQRLLICIYIYTYTSNWANVRFCGNIERKKCFVYIYIDCIPTHPWPGITNHCITRCCGTYGGRHQDLINIVGGKWMYIQWLGILIYMYSELNNVKYIQLQCVIVP